MSAINEFSSNLSYLNANLQSLGKYSRKGLFWSKSFLSYDKNGDWKVLQLNIIQVIARKLFGCYKETRLEKVIFGWNDYQAVHGNVCPELSEKLGSLWAKTHPKQILLPSPEVFSFGNAKLKDAEVIGICELFSDPDNSKFCGKILSEHYRDGDVILVEGVDANTKIAAKQVQQTMFLSKPAEIYGWEPVGFKELSEAVFESTISIENQFQSSSAIILKLLCNVNFLANPNEFKFNNSAVDALGLNTIEKAKLWEDLLNSSVKNFLNSLDKINERFADNNQTTSEIIQSNITPNSPPADFKTNYHNFLQTSKDKADCYLLISSLKDVHNQYSKLLQKKKYSSMWSVAQNNFFKNTWGVRQESLCNEVSQNRELKKRVFVCAGAAHFFPNKGKNSSEVIATISEHKFTLIISNIKQNATYYSFKDLAKKFGRITID